MTPTAEQTVAAVIARPARIDPASDAQRYVGAGALATAVEVAAGYVRDAIAPVTQAAYARDWDGFAAWCAAHHVDPSELPVDPVVVAAYLGNLATTIGSSVLRGRVAAIAYLHRRRGSLFVSSHPVIRETLSGIGRRHVRPVRLGHEARAAARGHRRPT